MDVPPDGGARRRCPGDLVRDRPRAIHRPRQRRLAPHALTRADGALRQRRARCSTRSSRSATRSSSSRTRPRPIDMVTGVAETRDGCDSADRQVPRPPSGRSRLRACLDAQPGRAAPAQCHRGRRAAVRAAGRTRCCSRTRPCARPSQRAVAEPSRPIRPVGLCHLRRPADRAAAASRDVANIDLVRQLVQAHAYWRLKGLAVDLVIWNEDHAGYRQRCRTRSWA